MKDKREESSIMAGFARMAVSRHLLELSKQVIDTGHGNGLYFSIYRQDEFREDEEQCTDVDTDLDYIADKMAEMNKEGQAVTLNMDFGPRVIRIKFTNDDPSNEANSDA